MDETSLKILDATMQLIMEKGYASTTTKDIAKAANVNESTIFRKFNSKKNIVLKSMKEKKWHPDLCEEDFKKVKYDLEKDMKYFAETYLSRVTPQFLKLAIGLRTPELFNDTSNGIMKIPSVFKESFIKYLNEMKKMNKISMDNDVEAISMLFLSVNLGFVFFKASFEDKLSSIQKEDYINNCISVFINGIKK